MPSPFLVKDAQYLLLTYPRVPEGLIDELPLRIVHLLSQLGAECLIGREWHDDEGLYSESAGRGGYSSPTQGRIEDVSDGGDEAGLLHSPRDDLERVDATQHDGEHLHVFVAFGRKFSTRNTRCFDIEGRHPNIAKVGKTPWLAWDYVCKEGNLVGGGYIDRPTSTGGDDGVPNQSDWAWILEADTREDFLVRLAATRPRELVCSFSGVMRYADWKYAPTPVRYESPQGIRISLESYPEVVMWEEQAFEPGVNRYVIFLVSTPPSPALIIGHGGHFRGLRRPLAHSCLARLTRVHCHLY